MKPGHFISGKACNRSVFQNFSSQLFCPIAVLSRRTKYINFHIFLTAPFIAYGFVFTFPFFYKLCYAFTLFMVRPFFYEHSFRDEISKRKGLVIGMAFENIKGIQRPHYKLDFIRNMKVWNESLHRHPDMDAIVLSNIFDVKTKRIYSTKQLRIFNLNPQTHISLSENGVRNRSIYDQRWYIMEWIVNQGFIMEYEYVLFADVSDTEFLRNPFKFMYGMDQIMSYPQLYVSTEIPNNDSWDWLNKWNCFNGQRTFKEGEGRFYNSGLTGGKLSRYKEFISQIMTSQRTYAAVIDHNPCNMAHVEKIVIDDLNETVITGYPFHTRFRRFDEDGMSFVRHK